MPAHEMLIVKKAFDFSKWLLHHTGKFPKSFRFSIAVRLENVVLEFTELVAVANMRSNKLSGRVGHARQANTRNLLCSLGLGGGTVV